MSMKIPLPLIRKSATNVASSGSEGIRYRFSLVIQNTQLRIKTFINAIRSKSHPNPGFEDGLLVDRAIEQIENMSYKNEYSGN